MARCVNDTSRWDRIRTAFPDGDCHSTSRSRMPLRTSSRRSWERSTPSRTSNDWSSIISRISLPLVTLMTVSPASG
jgi:hypothetical protein